jgi:SnoaL-like domain
MDWEGLAREFEVATDARRSEPGRFSALFASGGTYQDPVNPPLSDFDELGRQTDQATPDWHCEITAIAGGERAGAMEWIGRATLFGRAPFELHGCAYVEVDGQGLVTRWRDYFDLTEIERQTAHVFAADVEGAEQA